MYRSAALLPTGTNMDPTAPESNKYYNADQSYEIVVNTSTGKYRVLSTYGKLTEDRIGVSFDIHHDQNFSRLGYYTVVGIVSYFEDENGNRVRFTEGTVPAKKVPFWVYK